MYMYLQLVICVHGQLHVHVAPIEASCSESIYFKSGVRGCIRVLVIGGVCTPFE